MSFGVDSYGVGSFGTEESAGGTSPTIINCGYSPASALGYTAFISSLPTVTKKIAFIGDSNGDGRLSNNQPFTGSGSYVYKHDNTIDVLADPTGNGPYTYTGLDDGAGSGSLFPRVAQSYYNNGETILAVPCCKGGTQASNWTRSTLTSTQYGAMKARIDAVGGVDKIVIFLGANDAIGGVSQSTFVSRINTLVSDLHSDFPSTEIYLNKIHDFTGYGSNVQTIRAGVQEVWENNALVKRGADFDGITTSVHYTTDSDGTTASTRQYAALEGATVVGLTGTATATGYTASVSNVSGVDIACSYSPAAAVGYTSTIDTALIINTSYTPATALGYDASIMYPLILAALYSPANAVGYGASVMNISLTLTQADLDAIAEAVWNHPKALTVAKFLGLK